MRLKRKLFFIAVLLLVISGFAGAGYNKWYEYSPAGKAKVEHQAREWANDLGYKVIGVAARNDDSDGDGYVSVTVNVAKPSGGEELVAIECKKASWVMLSYGCRETKLNAFRGGVR